MDGVEHGLVRLRRVSGVRVEWLNGLSRERCARKMRTVEGWMVRKGGQVGKMEIMSEMRVQLEEGNLKEWCE